MNCNFVRMSSHELQIPPRCPSTVGGRVRRCFKIVRINSEKLQTRPDVGFEIGKFANSSGRVRTKFKLVRTSSDELQFRVDFRPDECHAKMQTPPRPSTVNERLRKSFKLVRTSLDADKFNAKRVLFLKKNRSRQPTSGRIAVASRPVWTSCTFHARGTPCLRRPSLRTSSGELQTHPDNFGQTAKSSGRVRMNFKL